jgi:DNA-binding transcriptional ArsR family regulator
MARSAAAADPFNAVAEDGRRRILVALAGRERPVNDLVRAVHMRQPQVSKHLRVLRKVGLVRTRAEGKQRLYSLAPDGLRPIHDWLATVEREWGERLDRLESHLAVMERSVEQTPTEGTDDVDRDRS